MSTKTKLSVEDFYQQFHGHEHHNDPGDHVKPHWFEINPTRSARHKKLNLKANAKAKALKRRKKSVVVHRNVDTMRYEMLTHRKAK
jgi:hypothetical protein